MTQKPEPTGNTIYDVYEFFLSADDLRGPVTVTIQKAEIKAIFNPQDLKDENKVVLRFTKAARVMALNKTQAEDLAAIAGTPVFSEWSGLRVVLTPRQLRKDTKTIVITRADESATKPTAPVSQTTPEKKGDTNPIKIDRAALFGDENF